MVRWSVKVHLRSMGASGKIHDGQGRQLPSRRKNRMVSIQHPTVNGEHRFGCRGKTPPSTCVPPLLLPNSRLLPNPVPSPTIPSPALLTMTLPSTRPEPMRTPRPFPDRLFVDLVPVTTFCSTRHLNAQDSPKSVLKGHCAVQNPGIRG